MKLINSTPCIALFLVSIVIFLNACIKHTTKYNCVANCTPIKISLNVSNKSNVNVLANTTYEIVLQDNLSGSIQNNRIMAKGVSDANGNFSTTVDCDTSLLNSDHYFIKINYTWDVNTVKVCYSTSKGFTLNDYPGGGEYILNVESYQKVNTSLNFIKKSTDSLKSAFFYITRDCYNSPSYSLNKQLNVNQLVNALSTMNGMNYITISSSDSLNNIHTKLDSFYVDNQFSGKTIEY